MRVYQVSAEVDEVVVATRYGSTAADAKTKRDELVEALELKKSQVTIEQIEIPTHKADFLEWLNELVTGYDAGDEEAVEGDGED